MPVVRVYVPLSGSAVLRLAESGEIPAEPDHPVPAFAVTHELAASGVGLDDEDLEYLAFVEAVLAAGAARDHSTDRRVVGAADADPGGVQPVPGSLGAIRLIAPVPLSRVASFHVEEDGAHSGAEADVADALLWYDVTELVEVCSFFR